MPTNENEAIPKFLINLAFFKINSWSLQVDDISRVCISGELSNLSGVQMSSAPLSGACISGKLSNIKLL